MEIAMTAFTKRDLVRRYERVIDRCVRTTNTNSKNLMDIKILLDVWFRAVDLVR
jgi:hypothetical protein